MSRPPESAPEDREDTAAVISAYGAFRVLLLTLAAWTFFSGFALLTHAVAALSFGGDGPGDRVAGAQMLVLAPIYALLVWRRRAYRLMLWVPYAAQVAIIVPVILNIVSDPSDANDGLLQLVVAFIFLVLLLYLWRESHPLGFFTAGGEEEWEEEEGEEDEDGEGDEEEEEEDEAEYEDEDEEEEEDDEEPPPRKR